jgi:hypothetical protein
MWSFDFSHYTEVVGTLQSDEFFETHQVVELPRFLLKGLKTFLAKLPSPSQQAEPDLSTYMMDALLPFQMEGLKFVIARKGRAMIADEMVCVAKVTVIFLLLWLLASCISMSTIDIQPPSAGDQILISYNHTLTHTASLRAVARLCLPSLLLSTTGHTSLLLCSVPPLSSRHGRKHSLNLDKDF